MSWDADAGWERLAGGRSGSEVFADGTDAVVKRLVAPVSGDPAERSRPAHVAWWRREADVLLDGEFADTPGVRSARLLDASEDDRGVVLRTEAVPAVPGTGPSLARALGRLAAAPVRPRPWWARTVLADRLDAVAERDGWPTLARTPLADVADRLWARRRHHLDLLSGLPQVPGHGDPTPANLRGRSGDDVIAVDWACAGSAAVGADLGYLALSCREDLDTLLQAYVAPAGLDAAQARTGAVVTACYTAITRTEQVLASAARGPGALAGKFRHPSVAPSIRGLQRLYPYLETLL
ncbi:hypothetical protein GCM10011519_04010 [Marmoricola endophyticus]|uniref:Phosphotransferase n=1 Tax=Marmoricola endophyticus TaxID=2040280 RepID=A0A917BB96_9ACTN|nr:phosphotransferase [Marmoricola endophyticus]GGF33756.1 hypothetical protein GCM10011519_04010 [Marmoricola endophyticus]